MVPRLVEKALSSGDVRRERTLVCEGLSGRVLEIGFGSGMNLPHLPPSVTAVDAVEPSDLGWEMSAARRGTASLPVSRVGLDGQRVDAESSAYDAVLCTFSLCTIPDAALAAREMARLGRPGGTVHVLEHGLSPDAGGSVGSTRSRSGSPAAATSPATPSPCSSRPGWRSSTGPSATCPALPSPAPGSTGTGSSPGGLSPADPRSPVREGSTDVSPTFRFAVEPSTAVPKV